jgi:hypothetical protein
MLQLRRGVDISKLQNMDKTLRTNQTNQMKYIEGKKRVGDKKSN